MTERFKTLTEAEMTPEQKRLVQAIIAGPRKAMRGGPFQAFLRSPELGDIVQQFGAHIRFKGVLPDPLKELAILVTARHWTAQYEWQAHRRMGEQAGLSPAIPDAIAEGRRPEKLSADEAAIYDFAGELVRTGEVSDKNFAAITDRWGERGAVELILTVGYYTTVSMILNVHRHPIPPDAKPLPPLKK
ncbi:MAG TPA: carboxymuconolactone decarboxylase family protein [Stellaceae bacterium]|nr:carboxymuconolactone decarboxylase family protein [Stellaceae bacterium]